MRVRRQPSSEEPAAAGKLRVFFRPSLRHSHIRKPRLEWAERHRPGRSGQQEAPR